MHIPVLLKEIIKNLNLKKGDIVVDATIDGGGDAMAICDIVGEMGKIIGIDQDENIIKDTEQRWKNKNCQTVFINGNFRDLDKLVNEKVDAILFDLGISSLQLENSGRGFSFQKDEPLLMTFKAKPDVNDLTAMEILNNWNEKEIADILFRYGEERYSRRIARGIIERRKNIPLISTKDLVETIEASVPKSYCRFSKIHCATRTFQALRIAVNDELTSLEKGLMGGWKILNKYGRMAVISFHSLEDKIVKKFFKEKEKEGEGKIINKKPIRPSEEEIKKNPRSRSAKLRIIEKLN